LIGVRADVSSCIEIHEVNLENSIIKMRAIPEVQLPSGFEVTFLHGQTNGYYLNLNLSFAAQIALKYGLAGAPSFFY
jgi:hypothetical protein